ncbi:MAG: hypothetical protein LH468_11420 [Nocardioides sp.]|nr:hypothetical protein [Nocardioides sp.]
MTSLRRWCLVALGVILVVAGPLGVRSWPAGENDVGATDLLAQVRAAAEQPYSGYVETQGALQLPVADRFTDVGALLGEQTRLRVWWRDRDSWRVDRLLASGEVDLVHDRQFTTEYDYQDAEATTSRDPGIRLPRTADLLPPALARRLLEDVADRATRVPARRVAGVSAPGLRLEPGSDRSSIDHVDLWADPVSGVPLRLEVYAVGASVPGFTTEFLDFSADEPARSRVTFTPTGSTEQSFDDVLDIADAANQYAPLLPPDTVAGLPRTAASDGAVGVYGRGLTQLVSIPLRGREASPLRAQLRRTLGVVVTDTGTVVSVGPLGLMLTGEDGDGGWLVAGSVTAQTLSDAALDLLSGTVVVDEGQDR